MLLFLAGKAWLLVSSLKRFIADEKHLYQLHFDQVEAEEMQMYTNSEAHQLLMERVRIEEMELQPDFLPMQQKYRLEQWYTKVLDYKYRYFQTLNVIEAGMSRQDNKVVALAERVRSKPADDHPDSIA